MSLVLKNKRDLIDKIRSFFSTRGLLEVTTPVLSPASITDPNIHSLTANYQVPGGPLKTLYLQTSPEFAMKRLLATGSGDIFQICPAFRNDVCDRWHAPEFTMLEWYRLGWDHFALMTEVEDLFRSLLNAAPAERISYCAAYQNILGWHPLEISLPDLQNCVFEKLAMHRADTLSRDECLDALMGYCIEPNLPKDRLIFIYDYPASQAALAKLNPQDPRVAARFEAYFQGIELANGFHELTDAKEQLARFQEDLKIRKARSLPPVPIDYDLIAALTTLPECAGVAVGVDRLIALALGLPGIKHLQ